MAKTPEKKPAAKPEELKKIPVAVQRRIDEYVTCKERSSQYWSQGSSDGHFDSDKSDRFAEEAQEAEDNLKAACKTAKFPVDVAYKKVDEIIAGRSR